MRFRSLIHLTLLACLGATPALGQGADVSGDLPAVADGVQAPVAQSYLDGLFDRLAVADEDSWQVIEADLERALAASGSPAMDLLLARGVAALNDDRPGDALDHLTALTDHAPDFAEGWNARATALYLMGHIGPALADIRRTLALEPRQWNAMTGLGIILEETGQPARALEVYSQVLAIHPHEPHVKEAVQRLRAVLGKDI